MKAIQQESVETAFQIGAARNIVVIKRSAKEWYFTFEADDLVTGEPETFALLTQRGQLRVWADPRTLFAYIQEKFAVTDGKFILEEDVKNESSSTQCNQEGP